MKFCPKCEHEYETGTLCPNDQTPLIDQTPRPDPLIGTTLGGKYVIEAKIARGGMGSIYRGHIQKSGLVVAIKILHENLQENVQDQRRFLREAKSLGEVKHKNVVALIDSGQTEEGRLYLVLEYLYGQTMAELLKDEGRVPLEMIMSLMLQVLDGAEAAHQKGIVHRDLTPYNVIIARMSNNAEVVKLVDFGIAKAKDGSADVTQQGTTVGTPGYLSPEQITGQADIDARSDIYSLGALLYYMLSGRKPYNGPHAAAILTKQMTAPPDPIDLEELGYARSLGPVLDKALARDPKDRHQSVAELREALQRATGVMVPASVSDGELKRTLSNYRKTHPGRHSSFGNDPLQAALATVKKREARRRGLIAAVVLLAAVAGAWALMQTKPKPVVVEPASQPAIAASAPVEVKPVRFGISADMGLLRAKAYVAGIDAAFNAYNAEAGAKRVHLVVLDDGGQVERAKANTMRMAEANIAAMFGNTKTETAQAGFGEVRGSDVVYFAPMTGSAYLRKKPYKPTVFHYRPTYVEEATALVESLTKTHKVPPTSVGIFAEDTDDGFACAKAGLEALEAAAHKKGLRPVLARFAPGAPTVQAASTLSNGKVKGVLLCSETDAAGDLVASLASKHIAMALTSRIDPQAIADMARGMPEPPPLAFAQVVPPPSDPVFRERVPKWKTSAAAYEGYVVGKLMTTALKLAEHDAEKLAEAFAQMKDVDVGTGPVHFSHEQHEGSQKVWLLELNEKSELVSRN